MKIRFLGPESLHLGFASAGVECLAIETAEEALPVIRESMNHSDLAILLISATVAGPLRGELEHIRKTRGFPLILEVPDLEQDVIREADLLPSLLARFGVKGAGG